MGQHGPGDYWIVKLSPDMVGAADITYSSHSKYLDVFPNPSTGKIFIKLSVEELALSVQIFNLLGQQILQQTMPNGESLDISSLPNGIYSVVATTLSGKSFFNKISKQE
ncbi:MAG: T9SS type A sorting domain-containing protein [Lewinellaceae bacterium]|nr:T9SS type A sorting domain-containing protein [Lewinellaceae bacterium]